MPENDLDGFITRFSLNTSSQTLSHETIEAAINQILNIETYDWGTKSSIYINIQPKEEFIKETREIELVLVKLLNK